MKVYVAAPWTQKDAARRYAEAIEHAGHTITKKWWEHREVPGYLDPAITPAHREELIQQANEDLNGVASADAFVLLNLEKSEGKAVETGVALFLAARIGIGPTVLILVGGKSNLFHYLPEWVDAHTVGDVLDALT